jgi:predicted phage terminase large subunit-like protein
MLPKALTKQQRAEIAQQTPAGLAWVLSDGRWKCARHLAVLNDRLLDLAAGRIKRLAVFMPPRHGKSQLCSRYFPAWFLQKFPDQRVIQAGYGNSFAATWGRHTRNAIDTAHSLGISPVRVDPSKSSADEWEILGHDGGMYCVGIGGGVAGRGADLLTIDDPVKSRAEADSLTYREKTWEWYTDDLYTRLHPGARILLVATRWHHDDLPGRILARDEGREAWTVINFPAIAEEDDALGREPGEALWPQRYDLAALNDAQATLGSYGFAALYQQRPAPREGGLFKRQWFEIVEAAPSAGEKARGWDLAGTEGGGDWTVGVRGIKNGRYYIDDVRRDQLSPAGVRALVRATAQQDGRDVRISLPQDPGQAGKDQGLEYIKLLAGYVVRTSPETGPKHLRAEAFAAQCEAGNVALVRGPWNEAFIDEFCNFNPDVTDQVDDQVDATSRWFAELTRGGLGGISAGHVTRAA